jgi:hypothetical protein
MIDAAGRPQLGLEERAALVGLAAALDSGVGMNVAAVLHSARGFCDQR